MREINSKPFEKYDIANRHGPITRRSKLKCAALKARSSGRGEHEKGRAQEGP